MPVANPRLSSQLSPESLNRYPNPQINYSKPCLPKVDSIQALNQGNSEVDLSEHPIEALFGLCIMVGLLGFYSISTLTTVKSFEHSTVGDVQILAPNQP